MMFGGDASPRNVRISGTNVTAKNQMVLEQC